MKDGNNKPTIRHAPVPPEVLDLVRMSIPQVPVPEAVLLGENYHMRLHELSSHERQLVRFRRKALRQLIASGAVRAEEVVVRRVPSCPLGQRKLVRGVRSTTAADAPTEVCH